MVVDECDDFVVIVVEIVFKVCKVIDERKICDWIEKCDVENVMRNDFDDLLFVVKGCYDFLLFGDDIDEMVDGII